MLSRIVNPLKAHSFFLFGARGTGKSTYIQQQFVCRNPWHIDLLDPEVEDAYARQPKRLELELASHDKKPDWIIIDEIQRVPRLLDLVHRLIEKKGQKFLLTGSSARKLKRGASNLLAGRAFVYHVFPLTCKELGDQFDLQTTLRWGSLPHLLALSSDRARRTYLKSYGLTYLKEEVQAEQLVRRLDPFRNFLEIAALASGQLLNFSKIGFDTGVDTKTVQSYYKILEETWIGFFLPAFHHSLRKSQRSHAKFYFFDLGVQRSLANCLDMDPKPGTSYYGQLFEQFIILEIYRLNHYYEKDFSLAYFQTKNGSEIDLILSKPKKNILLEIKSASRVDETEVRKLARLAKEVPDSQAYYLSQDTADLKIDGVHCRHWRKFLDGFGRV